VAKLRFPAPWFVILPLLLLALWHFTVARQWVAAGIIPSPEQVVRSWHTWIFGRGGGMMLSPYSGTWLDNVTYSSRRVLQGNTVRWPSSSPRVARRSNGYPTRMTGWPTLFSRTIPR